jgi:hypothetical protein
VKAQDPFIEGRPDAGKARQMILKLIQERFALLRSEVVYALKKKEME